MSRQIFGHNRMEDYWFINYTTKLGMLEVITRNYGNNRVVDKWQDHLLGSYSFYWSKVWDPTCFGREVHLLWFCHSFLLNLKYLSLPIWSPMA